MIYYKHNSQCREVISLNNIDTILSIAKNNNGIITTKMLSDRGIHREFIRQMVDNGSLEYSSRGVYILPDRFEDEMFDLQNRYKKGIFCDETVLFLCDFTDRTPNKYCMTFPTNYNTTSPKKSNVKCFQSKKGIYNSGIVDYKTPNGNIVKGYCIEKTLCDILIPRHNADIQIVSDAFKRYSKSKNKNIPLLSEYGKLLKVENKLRSYMEVLL